MTPTLPWTPADLMRVCRHLRHGPGDPTVKLDPSGVWLAFTTADGPGTINLSVDESGALRTQAWGDGGPWLAARAEAIAGLEDDLTGFDPSPHPLVARLARERGAPRFPRTGLPFPAFVRAALGQRVTGLQAVRSWAAIVRAFGAPAPGPRDDLWVAPEPARLADQPAWAFHRFDVETRRADVIRTGARAAARLQEVAHDPDLLMQRLLHLPGVGPWTTAETLAVACGDGDAVTIGDYHLPHVVTFALAGQRRGDDQGMLRLLAPFAGHRRRVVQLIAESGIAPMRRAPRQRIVPITFR